MDFMSEFLQNKNRILNVLDVYYGGGMVLVSENQITSNTTIITLTVPEGFKHLLLKCSLRTNIVATLDDIRMRINLDNTNSYDSMYGRTVHSASTSTTEALASNRARVGWAAGASAPASTFASLDIMINDYASTSKYKTIHSNGSLITNTTTGNIGRQFASAIWKNTSAINDIRLLTLDGVTAFVSGSKVSLYGIR